MGVMLWLSSLGTWHGDYVDDFWFFFSHASTSFFKIKTIIESKADALLPLWLIQFTTDLIGSKEYFLSDCQAGMFFSSISNPVFDTWLIW